MTRWWRGVMLGTALFAAASGCGEMSSRRATSIAASAGAAQSGQSGAPGQGGTAGSASARGSSGAVSTAGSVTEAAGRAGNVASSGAGGAAASGGQTTTGGDAGAQAGEPSLVAGAGGEPVLKETPEGWTCPNESYADGICDCGCGALDADCSSTMLAECERCNAPGSCSPGQCPGRIFFLETTQCGGAANGWLCADDMYGNGDCDCYCGVRDPDCQGAPASECPIPWEWRCRKDQYGDGASCDCGCGVPDPDCEAGTPDACDTCDGCGMTPCPDLVDTTDNSQCLAPLDWTCARAKFGDGVCDCGCGVFDADCTQLDYSVCERCPEESCAQGSCGLVAPDGSSHCWDFVPETWTCEPKAYRNGVCNCGCGATEPDCGVCEICNSPGSCSSEPCPGTIDPTSTTECAP